jgi:hypothetical protein
VRTNFKPSSADFAWTIHNADKESTVQTHQITCTDRAMFIRTVPV